jgi:predicted ATPase
VVFPRRRSFDNRLLLEREGVLASLPASLVEAGGGSGRLLFVGGEAGVGKTTVTGEFARGVDSVRLRHRVYRGTVGRAHHQDN